MPRTSCSLVSEVSSGLQSKATWLKEISLSDFWESFRSLEEVMAAWLLGKEKWFEGSMSERSSFLRLKRGTLGQFPADIKPVLYFWLLGSSWGGYETSLVGLDPLELNPSIAQVRKNWNSDITFTKAPVGVRMEM